MKKLIPLLLVLCLLLVPMAGNVSADDHENSMPGPVTQLSVDPAEGMAQMLTQPPVFEPGTVPADGAALDAISLPVHALVLSMLERDLLYDAQSDYFIWNALYYTLSMYGQVDDRAQLTEDALILPSEAVQDYLCALFCTYGRLPALPAELADRVSYDPVSDQYQLALGDFGLTEIRLDEPEHTADGLCMLNGALVSPENGSILSSFRVSLLENDSMFGFCVMDITIL